MSYFLLFAISLIAALVLTPAVKRFAITIGATDKPNERKVHQKLMPRMGGLAIYMSFVIGMLIMMPNHEYFWPIMIGATIITLTGMFDDLYELSAKVKLLGQTIAAVVVVANGIYVEFINLPFGYVLELGMLGIPLTLLWIVGITNAINLIDGLDGLAAGVSAIVLMTITTIAFMDGNLFIVGIGSVLLASTLGFLVYNFHPAKIFMGDTGSLFLGFMLSVISLLGFKSVTVFSLIVPLVILAVPISDTLFAIIRRLVNKQPLSAPDKSHLHHCLLRQGLSHRGTVLMIYGISGFFAISAVMLTQATLIGAMMISLLVLFVIEMIAEKVGLVNSNYRPLMNVLARFVSVRK